MNKNYYVLCYTREPQEDMIYANRLAYSMHLAISEDGESFKALNHNSGVLFAKATDNENSTMNPKSLKCPYIFQMADGSFGVVAVRTKSEGDADEESKGKVLFFTSGDLLQYTEVGLIDLNTDNFIDDVICSYDDRNKVYSLCWCIQGKWYKSDVEDLFSLDAGKQPTAIDRIELKRVAAEIEGMVQRNVIQIGEQIGIRLKYKLTTPENIAVEVPAKVSISTPAQLKEVRAKAIYSDGTTSTKTIDWNTEGVNWSKPGIYEITGTIHQDHYEFPIALNRADPCITKWNGKYYFIATNDADNNHTLYIREADSIPGLVNAQEVLLLDSDTYDHIKGLLWAPEFHVIGEDLYIFHAATTGEFFYEESHVMKLRKGGNPISRDDWSMPQRVLKKDGSYLCEAGKTISLDMTVIKQNNEYYVAWSERQFLPVDIGAWVYIAKIDPAEPWKLTSDPVLLTKPDYGWANNHTFVDEGPFALYGDSKLFLTFSSAAVDATYVVGLLTADLEADLLDPESWTKTNYPLLTSRSVPGEFGTGHNAYVIDDDGLTWNTYHARPGVDGPRSSGIRRVHFDIEGYPVLDLTEEKDLKPALRQVSTTLIVE